MGALLAKCAQMNGRPGTERPPGRGDFGKRSAVAVFDLGVEAPFTMCKHIRGIGAADHDEFGGERPQPLDVLDATDGGLGIHCAQCGSVENPLQCGLGDGVEVLGLAARKVRGAESEV